MNRRRHPGLLRFACCLMLPVALALSAGSLRAQTAPTETLKTGTSLSDADRQSIQTWIDQQVGDLSSTDPAARSAAKDALLSHTNGPAGQPASPTYLDAYANALNDELAPLASHNDIQIRLMAGIVAAQVAAKADNTQLLPVTLTLLSDKSEAVAYWGVRAAKYVLPAVLRNPLFQKNNKLQPAIVSTVKAHLNGPLGGPIAAEGYSALTLLLLDTGKADPNLRLVVGNMIDLFQARLELYKRASVPPEPIAERTPTGFLIHPAVWPALTTKQQRLAAMQAMSDLLSLASQHAQTADPQQRDALSLLVQQTAKSIWVGADGLKSDPAASQAIKDAVTPATAVGPQTPPPEMMNRVNSVFPVLSSHPELKGLTEAPTIAAKPDQQATTTRGTQ